jgi:hypothetical protein
MKVSWETARIAGTESTAKMMSVTSTTTSAASSGVAARLAFCLVKNLWPSNSVVTGMIRRSRERPCVASACSSALRCRKIFTPVYTRNTPKISSTHQNFVISAEPRTTKPARRARAPKMPQNRTRCWYLSGIAIDVNSIDQTNTLSTLSDFSMR